MIASRDSGFRDELAGMIPAVRAFARALVDGHHADAADELVQSGLIEVLNDVHACRGTRLRLRVLAAVIAAHRNSLRQTQPSQQAGAPGKVAPFRDASGLRWHASRRHASATRGTRLDTMPIEWRETLLLVTLESLTYVQTAECLGTTLSTVVTNLAHAREHLACMGPAPSSVVPATVPARRVPYLRLVK